MSDDEGQVSEIANLNPEQEAAQKSDGIPPAHAARQESEGAPDENDAAVGAEKPVTPPPAPDET